MTRFRSSSWKFVVAVSCFGLMIGTGLFLWGGIHEAIRFEDVTRWIETFGPAGPVIIICALAAAVVFSPLPSAPVALAAGAFYGHIWGTLYVVIGAELGALIAFTLARWLAHDTMVRLLADRPGHALIGSQNVLTLTVFVSRLIPFVSFDIVSYAAGLTKITTVRFAGATLAGIIPASFVLAHFGDQLAATDANWIASGVLLLGLLMFVLTLAVLRRAGGKRGWNPDAAAPEKVNSQSVPLALMPTKRTENAP